MWSATWTTSVVLFIGFCFVVEFASRVANECIRQRNIHNQSRHAAILQNATRRKLSMRSKLVQTPPKQDKSKYERDSNTYMSTYPKSVLHRRFTTPPKYWLRSHKVDN